MITTTRPTLLLEKEDRVWVRGLWYQGTIRGHSARTERYMVELDYRPTQRLHQRFIYRSREELIKVGGD